MLLFHNADARAATCETFRWFGYNPTIERYRPEYLRGEGLDDYGLQHIYGDRIRDKWSQQAQTCILSDAPYGFFGHDRFRRLRIEDRMEQMKEFVDELSHTSPNPEYQRRIDETRQRMYHLIIDPYAPEVASHIATLQSSVEKHEAIKEMMQDLPSTLSAFGAHADVVSELCSEYLAVANASLELEERCFQSPPDEGACDLWLTYASIDCEELSNVQAPSTSPELTEFTNAIESRIGELKRQHDVISTDWEGIVSAVSENSDAPGASDACSRQFPFGRITLRPSRPDEGVYGADVRYLYGDWDWERDFGIRTTVAKLQYYVESVAVLAARCFSDLEYGRISKDFYAREQDESDRDYYERALHRSMEVHAELMRLQDETVLQGLLNRHSSGARVTPALVKAVADARLALKRRTASPLMGLGWVVERALLLESSLRYHKRTRELVMWATTVIAETASPEITNMIVDMLINDVNGVMDSYGSFYSEDAKANLQNALDAIGDDVELPNQNEVLARLQQRAEDIFITLTSVLGSASPLCEFWRNLEAIYGSFAVERDDSTLYYYFGPLGSFGEDETPFCEGLE